MQLMQKAWKVMGISTVKPEGLPKAFTVVEKEVGEVFQVESLLGKTNFVETAQGDVVIYKEGVSGSSMKVMRKDLVGLADFLKHVYAEHCEHGVKLLSKCPGTPHRGHTVYDWPCPLDRS